MVINSQIVYVQMGVHPALPDTRGEVKMTSFMNFTQFLIFSWIFTKFYIWRTDSGNLPAPPDQAVNL